MRRREVIVGAACASMAGGTQALNPAIRQVLLQSYDPDARSFLAACTGSVPNYWRLAVNQLVKDLKACGAWSKLDAAYLLAAPDTQAARLNLVNPTQTLLVETNSPAFAAFTGYTGNGSNASLNGPVNMNAMTNFTQNSGHICAYSLTADQQLGNMCGSNTSISVQSSLISRSAADICTMRVNQVTGAPTVSVATGIGLYVGNRTSSSAVDLHKNGASIGTASSTSGTITAAIFKLLSGAGTFCTNQLCYASIGSNLVNVSADYYQAILKFMRAVTPAGTVLV